jgi:hypothetical protein
MKTTLDLDDPLLAEAKKRAAASGMSLKSYVEEALRARMLPAQTQRQAFKLRLPMIRGTRAPAVEVSDRRALYDFMDEDDDLR